MRRSIVLLFAPLSIAGGQQPPIRQLGPIAAKSSESWTNISGIRALPGGRLLANDIGGRKVVLLDSTLTPITVVADTTPATATAYSGTIANIIPFRADSTLFVDPRSMSMVVIDPNGKMTRVMALPRSEDAGMLGSPLGSGAGLDANGRLVYRAPFRFTQNGPPAANGGRRPFPTPPESSAIVRVDLTTRKLDTVGVIKIPKVNMQISQDDKGNMRMIAEVNPLPLVDEWAVLSDGTVAFVRGQDYHVEFVDADGRRTSAPKIPFEWQRLTDEDKVAFIDSVKAARARLAASAPNGAAGPAPAGAPAGPQRMVITMAGPGGGPPGGRGSMVAGGQTEPTFVAPSELPDYKPPFFANAVRADAQGNLWVRTIPTRQLTGGPVYDVINREGKLVDRVQVPTGRLIIGFAPDGIVYLTSRTGQTMTLERARVR
jgi:hypothetical protein